MIKTLIQILNEMEFADKFTDNAIKIHKKRFYGLKIKDNNHIVGAIDYRILTDLAIYLERFEVYKNYRFQNYPYKILKYLFDKNPTVKYIFADVFPEALKGWQQIGFEDAGPAQEEGLLHVKLNKTKLRKQ